LYSASVAGAAAGKAAFAPTLSPRVDYQLTRGRFRSAAQIAGATSNNENAMAEVDAEASLRPLSGFA